MSKNPIRVIRETLGLTLLQASAQAHVHLQAFFLQEQGVYPHILPSVLLWMNSNYMVDSDVEVQYREFQRAKRKLNGELHALPLYEVDEPTEGNPFVHFRENLPLSRLGFAKKFCVHPGLLYRVEQGISQEMPEQLKDALAEAGLQDHVIAELSYRIGETCQANN